MARPCIAAIIGSMSFGAGCPGSPARYSSCASRDAIPACRASAVTSTPCVARGSPLTSSQRTCQGSRPSSSSSSVNTHRLPASRTASSVASPATRWSAMFSPATNSSSHDPVSTTSGRYSRIRRAMSRRSGSPYSSTPSGCSRNVTSVTPTAADPVTCSRVRTSRRAVRRRRVHAGLPAGEHQVGDVDPAGGPHGDRGRGAVLDVVGVRDDAQHATELGVRQRRQQLGHARDATRGPARSGRRRARSARRARTAPARSRAVAGAPGPARLGALLPHPDRPDGDPRDVLDRPAVHAGADRGERDARRIQPHGQLEGPREAGRQQHGVGLPPVPVRPDGVDHPAGGEAEPGGRDGVPDGQPVRQRGRGAAPGTRPAARARRPRGSRRRLPRHPSRDEFAALTTTSTSCVVMSPRTASISIPPSSRSPDDMGKAPRTLTPRGLHRFPGYKGPASGRVNDSRVVHIFRPHPCVYRVFTQVNLWTRVWVKRWTKKAPRTPCGPLPKQG